MISYCIFISPVLAAANGVNTYIDHLVQELCKRKNCQVTLIYLFSNEATFKIESNAAINKIWIPTPATSSSFHVLDRQAQETLAKTVYFLTARYFTERENLIFHFNHSSFFYLAETLKSRHNCHILYTVHFIEWKAIFERDYLTYVSIHKQMESKQYDLPAMRSATEIAMFSLADRIICVTNDARKELGIVYKEFKHKLCTIHNGIPKPNKLHAPLSAGKENMILYVGRITRAKGILRLVDAFKIVVEKIPTARLVLIGDGDYNTVLSNATDIWDKIVLTGKLSKDKIQEFYNKAQLCVIPSFHEQCSYTALEAMQQGIPVISTSIGGLNELFPPKQFPKISLDLNHPDIDNGQLADAIIALMNDERKRQRLSHAATRRARDMFATDQMINHLLREVTQMLAG
jgi:glycosyltransferase involved in cell wall biosynthesis